MPRIIGTIRQHRIIALLKKLPGTVFPVPGSFFLIDAALTWYSAAQTGMTNVTMLANTVLEPYLYQQICEMNSDGGDLVSEEVGSCHIKYIE